METTQKVLLTESISINTEMIKAQLGHSSDLLERELVLPYLNRKVHLIFYPLWQLFQLRKNSLSIP